MLDVCLIIDGTHFRVLHMQFLCTDNLRRRISSLTRLTNKQNTKLKKNLFLKVELG